MSRRIAKMSTLLNNNTIRSRNIFADEQGRWYYIVWIQRQGSRVKRKQYVKRIKHGDTRFHLLVGVRSSEATKGTLRSWK